MNNVPTRELPLPIAALRRRAINAKSPKDQHDTAYYAWEASIRLRASLDPPAHEALVSPAIGRFVESIPWSKAKLSPPSLGVLSEWLAEHGKIEAPELKKLSAAKLAALFPPYRNRVLGHGSSRPARFYQDGATLLLAGLDDAWHAEMFLGSRAELVWVESVAVDPTAQLRPRIFVLHGLAPHLERDSANAPDGLLPETLAIRENGLFRAVSPLLEFDPTELRERVLFLNGYRRTPTYLDYVSGDELRDGNLATVCPLAERRCQDFFQKTIPAGADRESATTDAKKDPRETSRFGDFELLGKLGEGGMGAVFLARQRSLGRLIALKMLPLAAATDEIAVARFNREIRALGRCDHPNVVKILSKGLEDGTHYYAMEFVDGADLSAVGKALPQATGIGDAVRRATADLHAARVDTFASVPALEEHVGSSLDGDRWRALATLFRDAAAAVEYLHRQGIIHRDLKPANLMITAASHQVVVMDLGLAMLGDASRSLTRDASGVVGTLRYMPPEQLQRRLVEVDHRADVYSLGATFYELCTEKPLFDGDTDARLVQQIIFEEPRSPRQTRPDLPVDLGTILQKATQKDPRDRYLSAEALRLDLDAFLHGRPISARAPTLGYVLLLALRRHKALAVAIASATVVVILGTVGYVRHEQSLRQEAERALLRAENAENETRLRNAELIERQGRHELAIGHPDRAAVLLYEAYRQSPEKKMLAYMALARLRRANASFVEFVGHTDAVNVANFSPGGGRLLTGGRDGTVRIWDSQSGRQIDVIHRGSPVIAAAWADRDHVLVLDELRRLTVIRLEPDRAEILSANVEDFSGAGLSDGRLVLASSGGIDVWEVQPYAHVTRIIRGKAANKNKHLESSASNCNNLSAWEFAKSSTSVERDEATFLCLTNALQLHEPVPWGGGRRLLATKGALSAYGVGRTILIEEAGTPRAELEQSDVVQGGDFSTDGRLLTFAADGSVRVWTLEESVSLIAPIRQFSSPAFTPDGSRIVTDDSLLRSEDGAELKKIGSCAVCDNRGEHLSLRFSAKATRFIDARRGEVCDTETGTVVGRAPQYKNTTVSASALSPDGAVGLVGYDSGSARSWRVDTGEIIADLGPFSGAISDVAFSPDGSVFATASGASAMLWAANGSRLAVLAGHQSTVHSLVFSPNGEDLATVSSDGTVRVWAVHAPQEHPRLLADHSDGVSTASYSRDGRRIVTCAFDGRAVVWDAHTGAIVSRLLGHSGPVLGCALSSDGERAFTASADHTVRIWAADDGILLATIVAHSDWVTRMELSSDDRRLLTANPGLEPPRLWDVALPTVSPEEISRRLAGIPLRLEGGRLVSTGVSAPIPPK